MSIPSNKFHTARRPGEYIAFSTMETRTLEGPAFMYIACDAFSEFGFMIGTDSNENPETILKHIYLLTEHPDFVRHMNKGFTLVFDRFGELEEQINKILSPKGKMLLNVGYHKRIITPLRDSLSKSLIK